jgi:hypothetical protein
MDMRALHLLIFASLFIVTGQASALVVMENFTAIATGADPFTGNSYTGTVSYDDTGLTGSGAEVRDPVVGLLTVDFMFEGQDFDETNDLAFDFFPVLDFFNGELVFMDYWLEDGVNGVDFTDPTIIGVSIFSDVTRVVGAPGFTVEVFVDAEPSLVPEPTTIALLSIGLMGLVFHRRLGK